MKIPAYTKVLTLGHRHTERIIDGRAVRIEEKIDGSQLSAMKSDGVMYYRTRRTEIFADTDDKLFKKAVDWFEQNQNELPEDVIFRCEALMSKRHNHLEYERAPESGFILWDIEGLDGDVHSPVSRKHFCNEFGIDCLEPFYCGRPEGHPVEFFKSFLGKESMLGGSCEGIVIKPVEFLAVPETATRQPVTI
jgi:ATP-dependent RNA circularization protein (DNA/RNA ligase family)